MIVVADTLLHQIECKRDRKKREMHIGQNVTKSVV